MAAGAEPERLSYVRTRDRGHASMLGVAVILNLKNQLTWLTHGATL